MGNILVALVIGGILYLAIKPIIRFKKQNGSSLSCYKCAYHEDGQCSSASNQCE